MKNKILLVSMFLLLTSSIGYSYPRNIIGGNFVRRAGMFARMDRHALNASARAEKTLKGLVKYLIRPAKNELDKARVIWRWITANIKYGKAGDTFKNRRGVCAGYAKLYKRMGKLAGLEVAYIVGWSKGYNLRPGAFTSGGLHAWNAVKIKGLWYLLDATWGAGSFAGKKFVFRHNDFFFLTKPTQFIFNHLPHDTRWQILKKPVDIVQYNEWPKVLPFFFENNMRPLSHYISVHYVRLQDKVKLFVPTNVKIFSSLVLRGKLARHQPRVSRSGKTVSITMKFNNTGQYVLNIRGRKKGSSKTKFAMQYSFISGGNRKKVILHNSGSGQKVKLFYPKLKNIPANRNILFYYHWYQGDYIKVKNGGKVHIIKANQAGRFYKRIFIRRGKVEVYIKHRQEKRYRPLAFYVAG